MSDYINRLPPRVPQSTNDEDILKRRQKKKPLSISIATMCPSLITKADPEDEPLKLKPTALVGTLPPIVEHLSNIIKTPNLIPPKQKKRTLFKNASAQHILDPDQHYVPHSPFLLEERMRKKSQ